jgi:predicted enzyme related to lactoylglutathione lyase
MNEQEKINYVELPASNLQKTKEFFIEAFGWSFQDFGPEYSAFSNQGLDGRFYQQIVQVRPPLRYGHLTRTLSP